MTARKKRSPARGAGALNALTYPIPEGRISATDIKSRLIAKMYGEKYAGPTEVYENTKSKETFVVSAWREPGAPDFVMAMKAITDVLRGALQSGALQASIAAGTLQAAFWQIGLNNAAVSDGVVLDQKGAAHVWHVARGDFEGWLGTIKPATKTTSFDKGQKVCRDWLVKEMKAHPIPTKSKEAYRQEAEKLFDVGSRAFIRAWDGAIERANATDWSKPGRKSKRRIDTLNHS